MGIELIPELAGAIEAAAGSKITQDLGASLAERGASASARLAGEAWTMPTPKAGTILSARSFFINTANEADAFANLKEFPGIGEHNADGFLPAGVHGADWDEFASKLGFNDHRQQLLDGVKPMLSSLQELGLRDVFVGGSFVTSKINPNDIDFVAPLGVKHPSPLWNAAIDLQVGSEFGQDLKISHLNEGLNSTNMKLMRFNQRPGMPKYELGIVHLNLPA